MNLGILFVIHSIKLNNRPKFNPPPEYDYKKVEEDFESLNEVEKPYEKKLLEERVKYQSLFYIITKFNQKVFFIYIIGNSS